MKYTLTNKTITILEHILWVAEKSSKTVQFCFTKGTKQYYINPQNDIYVTFELEHSIKFEYPISNLKTFLGKAIKVLDSEKNKVDKSKLVLPTHDDIKYFEGSKVLQTIDFKLTDLNKIKPLKQKYLNIIGENKKCVMRVQNHINDWWFDDGNKKIFPLGKSSRKFRYVLEKIKLKLLPNDYKLILKKDVVRFQFKHLNYYFIPEVWWERQSVKDWVTSKQRVTDKVLISLYQRKGYM
jgi:hypothetical protein